MAAYKITATPPTPPPPTMNITCHNDRQHSWWESAKRGRGESRYWTTLDYLYTGTLPYDIPIIPLPPYYGNFFRQNETSCTQFLTAFPASRGFLVAPCFGRRTSSLCEKPSDFLICRCLRFCWNNLKILVSNRLLSECCQNVCALWYACSCCTRQICFFFTIFMSFLLAQKSAERQGSNCSNFILLRFFFGV